MRQIPIPWMVRDKPVIVARQPIENPVGGGHVRIIVGTVHLLSGCFVPTGPALPVQIALIVVRRQLIGLIVEQTLADTILVRSIFVLQATPQNAVDKLLIFFQLFLVRLA